MKEKKLVILWTTDHKEVVLNMLLMYASNSMMRDWWKKITIIVWGPSQKLVANDVQIQGEILNMQHHEIQFEACKDCADNYDLTDRLERMGFDVKYMGESLSNYQKDENVVMMYL